MEEKRVVQVRGQSFGSGYLIAPRLVLTAAHLLPASEAPGEITVSYPDSDARFPAVVRWRQPDENVDGALLEIPAEVRDWEPPETLRGAWAGAAALGSLRDEWGPIAGRRHGIPTAAAAGGRRGTGEGGQARPGDADRAGPAARWW
ncbi:hypothetical protein QQY66_26975 [Streptomyces sp. DG2A-72]|uniref:hypothetical protein n=1 Tax=Streptomyces sp. DG2A-72 TaxID=3051386 RepID=UPI00265B98F8|nr:hypothetical protein [Streptomyces sp. DG2A-72]MDO0935134.1 hypothetical protein [Streptomyces sp. DG2A-72]